MPKGSSGGKYGGSNTVQGMPRKSARPASKKWEKTTAVIKDMQGRMVTAYSDGGDKVVFKDGGGRFRIYDTKAQRTVTQAHGAGLVFNKLKDAKAYASKM